MKSSNIATIVSNYFNVDFAKQSRKRNLIYIRSMCSVLCKKYTKESLEQIGANYTNNDHATVLHSIRMFKDVYSYQTEPFNVLEEYEILDNLIYNVTSELRKQQTEEASEELRNSILTDKNINRLSYRCIELQKQVKALSLENMELKNIDFLKVEKRFIAILSELKDMSDSDILDFTETRLKPFKKALEHRVIPKVFLKHSVLTNI
jgi:hypothetical protein